MKKTECRYSYEPVKKGRNVVAIRLKSRHSQMQTLRKLTKIKMTFEQWQEGAIKKSCGMSHEAICSKNSVTSFSGDCDTK